MYLNDKEEKIIAPFYKKLDDIIGCTLLLEWDTGSAVSIFDTTFDDEDEDEDAEEYEEFTSFLFRSISVTGKPPISVSGDNLFLVNYRNFPKSIKLNGKDII